MKRLKKIGAFLLIGAIAFSACKKDEENEPQQLTDDDKAVLKDMSEANQVFDDVFNQVDEGARESNELNKMNNFQARYGSCAQLSVDTAANPIELTIDFGSSNCLGSDGRYRRGKIIATFSGLYRDSGTVISTTFDNYFLNDQQIQGTKIVTNKGHNSNGNLEYEIQIQNANVTTTRGVVKWNSTRTREWVQGENTIFNIFDDVYEISGSGNGTTATGVNFDVDIKQPLQVKIGCWWIVSGLLDITPSGRNTWSIDYGNGNCDRLGDVTINGNTYQFQM